MFCVHRNTFKHKQFWMKNFHIFFGRGWNEMAPANLLPCGFVKLFVVIFSWSSIRWWFFCCYSLLYIALRKLNIILSFEMVNAPPSHSISCSVLLCPLPILIGFWPSSQFQITHMEMIKGIKGHGYYDELVVPIIDNTAHEHQLTESFTKAVCFFLMVLHTSYIYVRNSNFHEHFF